jgi:uncharacterized protein YjiS (DUF1127 family)
MKARIVTAVSGNTATQGQSVHPSAVRTAGLGVIVSLVARVTARASTRDRQRRVALGLASMSDHALRDIGLHRSQILSVTRNTRSVARLSRA